MCSATQGPLYERQSTVESTRLAHLIRISIKTVVWNQNDDQLDLILRRTWAADFLGQISTQLVVVDESSLFAVLSSNYV